MTTTETPAGTELDPAALVTWARLRDLQAKLADLKVEEETLKGQLREHLGTGTFLVGGRPMFTISPTNRFDAAYAETVLTPEELAQVQRTVIDTDLAKKVLGEARYKELQRPVGKPTVRAS